MPTLDDLKFESARNESVAIATSNTNVSAPKVRRVLYIRNTSAAAVITVVQGNQAAVSGAGIILKPNEYFIDSSTDQYFAWAGQVNAIADAANGTIAIYER